MSEFTIHCPACRTALTADEAELGMSISCPYCSSEITLPLSLPENAGATGAASNRISSDQIPVTSGGVSEAHEVLGMVCCSIGTRGGMGREFERLKAGFSARLAKEKQRGQLSQARGLGQITFQGMIDSDGDFNLAAMFAGASFQSSDMEIAFMIAVGELRQRASFLGAHAVIGFRWDLDLDSNNNVLNFIGFAYGTAVRRRTS